MKFNQDLGRTILGFVTGVVALGLLFVWWVYPEIPTATYTFAVVLLLCLGALAWLNQKSLRTAVKTRTLRYGANAAITVALVIAILATLNFLNHSHFYRKDLTKDSLHSLSDQTVKILKELKSPVKLTVFVKTIERDAVKGVVDNYLYHGGKNLSVEYVDPDRDKARAKAANVKKYGTVIISSGNRDTRVEEVNEEKLTNGLIKVLKDKKVTVCFLQGHGEKSIEGTEAEGYAQLKSELASQNYEARAFSLLQDAKVPEECTIVMVAGPGKNFFEKETNVLRSWLNAGGRAVFALDPNLKSDVDTNKDLKPILNEWYLDFEHNLVLDPTSRLLGANPTAAVVANYNKDHVITKEMQLVTLFQLASTMVLKENPPSWLKTWWLAKTTPQAFAKNNFKEIASGAVKIDPNKDAKGPFIVMAAVEGARPPAQGEKPAQDSSGKPKETRIIALSSSQVGANQYIGYGANSDLLLNSLSWLADDEGLISIRAKEEATQLPTLSQTQASIIQFLTMIIVPGFVLLAGVFVWWRRRRL